jgi:RNA polymerase sigma factor (sigma-70 family)
LNTTATHQHRGEWQRERPQRRPTTRGIKINNLTHDERLALVASVEKLMWKEAGRFARVNHRWLTIEDAYQEIWAKVFRGATCYDPSRGAKFVTHACNWIMSARTSMLAEHKRMIQARSIDAPMAGDERYTLLADELHTDTGPKGVAWTQAEWDETLCVLDARSRKVVELHLVHDMSFAQVAGVLGVSSERAKQLYRAAKARLQRFECEMGLFDEVA